MRGMTRHSGRGVQGNLGPYLSRVIWSLATLSALFLGLRLYCKLWRNRKLWWDDHFLIASWIALVVSVALQSVAVADHGLGQPFINLDAPSISAIVMYSYPAGFGCILATCWSKTSFAISLLCISTGRTRLTYSGAMDIVLAPVPWKIILTATINRREKLGVSVAMSVGVLSGVMAFLKIKMLGTIGNSHATAVNILIFGTAEPATSIMAASIPILRAFIRREPHAKPARFIEKFEFDHLDSQKTPPSSALGPLNDDNAEQSAEDSRSKITGLEAGSGSCSRRWRAIRNWDNR
ncbi:hypothetical protein C8A00DRAFT_44252 [Chaetomidium leptoderma]|uniref:Rhodopsin domain-containing protein n=1 Tax=Chaetomidium leptoderma TaxID=669021 RepID=A0AAN6ZVR6_9PEZI|nr:hypothetical protein C8A00DRAFT_44252 [Chaetomidium leptoderma]